MSEENNSQGIVRQAPQSIERVDPVTRMPRGFEAIEREDIIVARIAIGQPTSKPVMDNTVRNGALYNTLTLDSYVGGEGTGDFKNKPYLEFIPVLLTKTRRYWNPDRKNDSICMSNDAKVSVEGKVCATQCPYGAYDFSEGQNDKGQHVRKAPACTLYTNFFSVIPPYTTPFPVSISMAKTSAKIAKQFISFMLGTGEDLFARVWRLTTESRQNEKGNFTVYQTGPVRQATLEEYMFAESVAKMMKGSNIKVHDESGAAEDGTGAQGDQSEPTVQRTGGSVGDDDIPF